MEQEQNVSAVENVNNVSTPNVPTGNRVELSSIQDLLTKAFEIFKDGFWKYIGMMLIPLVGALPIVGIFFAYGLLKLFSNGNSLIINAVSIFLALLGVIAVLALIYAGLVAQAGLLILVGGGAKMISVKDAFLKARKYAWKLLIINLSVGLFTILWGLLFIIPGVIMSVYYSFARWSFFYEGFTGTATLKRSKELVKGYWRSVFVRSIGLYLVLYLTLSIFGLLIGGGLLSIVWSVLKQIIMFISAPFFMIISSIVYLELKEIKGESMIEKKGRSVGLIVLAIIPIIGIISTIAVVSIRNASSKARDARIISDAKMIEVSVAMYEADYETYPEKVTDLKHIPISVLESVDYTKTTDGFSVCFELKNNSGNFKKGRNCLTDKD